MKRRRKFCLRSLKATVTLTWMMKMLAMAKQRKTRKRRQVTMGRKLKVRAKSPVRMKRKSAKELILHHSRLASHFRHKWKWHLRLEKNRQPPWTKLVTQTTKNLKRNQRMRWKKLTGLWHHPGHLLHHVLTPRLK